jgi:hypothetical protein
MSNFILPTLVVAACAALLIRGTRARNKMGVNGLPTSCPKCGTKFGRVRFPRTLRQALWGGNTCANCGCEIDKWGREIPYR